MPLTINFVVSLINIKSVPAPKNAIEVPACGLTVGAD